MPLFDLFWAMLWFFMWVAWIWLLISVFGDIFRSDDLSGWGKAAWAIGTLVVPLIGVLVYLIARGDSMQQRTANRAAESERALQGYIRSVAATSTSDELARLAELRDSGVLTEDEFQAQKARVLAT